MTAVASERAFRLHVVPELSDRDIVAAEAAAAAFLEALGIDINRPGLAETPGRMARAWSEMLTPREFDLTTFDNDESYDELVLVQDIRFRSVCEHHMLPFIGTAQVGYLPGERVIGISKLARVVELFACQPQTQERMTQQVAGWLTHQLAPKGVGVVLRAQHLCMTLRGVLTPDASTTTCALRGRLLDDPRTRAEFLALARSDNH